VDRRLTLREILEKVFGLIPRFKSKDELLEEEFAKFVADYKPDEPQAIPALKTYFKAYVTSDQRAPHHRHQPVHRPGHQSDFSLRDLRAVPRRTAPAIPGTTSRTTCP
jgi:type I restriction enzyme R subunit